MSIKTNSCAVTVCKCMRQTLFSWMFCSWNAKNVCCFLGDWHSINPFPYDCLEILFSDEAILFSFLCIDGTGKQWICNRNSYSFRLVCFSQKISINYFEIIVWKKNMCRQSCPMQIPAFVDIFNILYWNCHFCLLETIKYQ